jgi:prevent-host-death family protein
MHVWQLQEAKAKLTQLIKNAALEPQVISRHGIESAIVMSREKYEELTMSNENIVSFLKSSPLCEVELDMKRDHSPSRKIEL